eukprot:UN21112
MNIPIRFNYKRTRFHKLYEIP